MPVMHCVREGEGVAAVNAAYVECQHNVDVILEQGGMRSSYMQVWPQHSFL